MDNGTAFQSAYIHGRLLRPSPYLLGMQPASPSSSGEKDVSNCDCQGCGRLGSMSKAVACLQGCRRAFHKQMRLDLVSLERIENPTVQFRGGQAIGGRGLGVVHRDRNLWSSRFGEQVRLSQTAAGRDGPE